MTRVRAVARAAVRVPALLLVIVLRGYQLVISPMLGPTCRYAPSCSSYAVTAIRQRGAVAGCWLAARRLLRCHPWAAGGWDPVPERHRAPSSGTPSATKTTRTS